MFMPYIIRRSRNNQHYALICSTPLFYILAPTCFDSSLPSSGSFLDPSELLEIQIEWVVCHIMCAGVSWFRGRIKERYSTNQCIVLVISSTNKNLAPCIYSTCWVKLHINPYGSSTR
jgi:hypothetical protein